LRVGDVHAVRDDHSDLLGGIDIVPVRNEGTIEVEAGASITAADTGSILIAAPYVINAGHLRAPQGQVISPLRRPRWR
jgi:hypothetical protein